MLKDTLARVGLGRRPAPQLDEDVAFARRASTLGHCDCGMETKVDMLTQERVLRFCRVEGTTPAALIRNFLNVVAHGKSWDERVAEEAVHVAESGGLAALVKAAVPAAVKATSISNLRSAA